MESLKYAVLIAVPLFAIIDPPAAIPAFLSMTPHDSDQSRIKMAFRACVTCALILISFTLMGTHIFQVFGISLPSFQIAGGLILLLVALDNLQARHTAVKQTEEETHEGAEKPDISITPLAVPMLAGPGAISMAIVLDSRATSLTQKMILYAVIALVSAASFGVFYVVIKMVKKINHIAMNIMMRLVGLLLAAVGVEFIINGIKASGIFR